MREQQHNVQDLMDKGGPRVSDCIAQIVEDRWLKEVDLDELWVLRRHNPNLVAYLRHEGMTLAPNFARRYRS